MPRTVFYRRRMANAVSPDCVPNFSWVGLSLGGVGNTVCRAGMPAVHSGHDACARPDRLARCSYASVVQDLFRNWQSLCCARRGWEVLLWPMA